jgi:hypothetical protein
MHLQSTFGRKLRGFTLFDLLCFIAACSLIFPLALVVSRHFPAHRAAVFFLLMLIVYPVVGFTFAICLRRLFRYFAGRSKKYPILYDD